MPHSTATNHDAALTRPLLVPQPRSVEFGEGALVLPARLTVSGPGDWVETAADLLAGGTGLWLVPAGTHSHTSRSLERWPSCSITPSGRVTLPKWVLAPRIEVEPMNNGAGSWISGGGESKSPWAWSTNS